MTNEKIGTLGEAFIQTRLDLGIDFDSAWNDWLEIQKKLTFVLADCPEVQLYDDRRVSDCLERERIRELAKEKIGDHIRSGDVSLLRRVGQWINTEVPVKPYRMDRLLIAEHVSRMADSIEAEHGFGEQVVEFRQSVQSEAGIEKIARVIERFAETHSLWAVPVGEILDMYQQHLLHLSRIGFDCASCGRHIEWPIDIFESCQQPIIAACPACGCKNTAVIRQAEDGETEVLSVFEPNEK